MSPGHRRVGPALVHENLPSRVHAGEFLAEFPPLLPDLRAVLLLARGTFFLRGRPNRLRARRDGHKAARGAEPLAAFLEGGIGLLSDQLAEPLPVLGPEYGRVATAVGLGVEVTGRPVGVQQPSDEGNADQEPPSDLAQGFLTALDRIEHPLPEILGIGSHRTPPYQDLLSNDAPSTRSAL